MMDPLRRSRQYAVAGILLMLVMLAVVAWPGDQVAGQSLVAGYVLGPEDVLEVSVWGYPDLTHVVMVRPDGKISLPLAGTIEVAGLAVESLIEKLTGGYAVYIVNPQVSVIVKEFRKIRVSVLGQVAHPGTYFLPPGARLLDALSIAGGVMEAAALKETRLLHSWHPPRVVNLQNLLAGDPAANVALRGGETLVVPEDVANLVSVLGEVAHPGRFRLKGEMRVLDALVAAGGLTDHASVTQANLVRASNETQPLDLGSLLARQDMSQNIALQPGDALIIPEETNDRIFVIGDVAHAGNYRLKGEVTLLQAVAMAGGPVQRGIGTAQTAHIVRRNDTSGPVILASTRGGNVHPIGDRGVLISVDLQAMMRGDLKQDEVLHPGDVVIIPETTLSALPLIVNMVSTILFGLRP